MGKKYPKVIVELARALRLLKVKCKKFSVEPHDSAVYKVYVDGKYYGLYDTIRKTFVD